MLWSHVLDAAFNAPANKLDCVPASHLAGDVLVDAAGVVFKVRVDGEGGLDWATFHDHLLNLGFALRRLHAAGKRVLVLRKRSRVARAAGRWALRGRLLLAARGAFCRVRVKPFLF